MMQPLMHWRYFDPAEFSCQHCGQNFMDHTFIDRLDHLRGLCGFPLIVTSGYRCPAHNQAVSTTGPDGPHVQGLAADFAVSREKAVIVLQHALNMEFAGIGINQKGGSRFIHLDCVDRPVRTIWSYP